MKRGKCSTSERELAFVGHFDSLYVKDLSRSFNDGACLSLCANFPLQKSAVKLTNGKATEVRRIYLVRGVTVTECDGSSWIFCRPDEGRNVGYRRI